MPLKEPQCKLLVDLLILEEWYEKGILDDANECFEIMLPIQEKKTVDGERLDWSKRKEIYDKLEKLKLALNKLTILQFIALWISFR